MKVVLDTNVLIAAQISSGACRKLLDRCLRGHEILISEVIFAEVIRHLSGKFRFPADQVDEFVSILRSRSRTVIPTPPASPTCRDPDDDLILGTAIAGSADCLITGDQDLLVLRGYREIPILRPSEFPDFEARSGSATT